MYVSIGYYVYNYNNDYNNYIIPIPDSRYLCTGYNGYITFYSHQAHVIYHEVFFQYQMKLILVSSPAQ